MIDLAMSSAAIGMPSYRPEFLAALDLLARACALLQEGDQPSPVLVGGAVVEIETSSAVTTGDFDLIPRREADTTAALEPAASGAITDQGAALAASLPWTCRSGWSSCPGATSRAGRAGTGFGSFGYPRAASRSRRLRT